MTMTTTAALHRQPARRDAAWLRKRMRGIGARRIELQAAQRQIQDDTTTLLVQAHGVIGVTESARLLKIARSHAYQVLREQRGDGDDDRGVPGGSA